MTIQRFETLDDYVNKLGGKRVIHKILLANNGISAVKCIRSMRQWAYTYLNKSSLHFVAMATPEDLKANAEYIRMADQFVEVPGGSNVNNYANVNLICQIAQRFKVDAVWAGWGHASEKPSLPSTLKKLGMVFIGPGAEAMYALGDKIGSTIIAQSASVPTIKWNGSHLKTNYKDSGKIPPELYAQANVATKEDCIKAVKEVGIPVMIKASEGGGGKGIRMLNSSAEADIETAFRQVQSEVPGSPIFVMKLASKSRHLEVQLIADEYGNAIALNGRDCSVQRRHQKILEEGPPSIVNDISKWREMEAAAVRLAHEVGYVNAGTVEYLYSIETEEFFFLELNPRLQVEHPVTEMITGVNLPALQLNVAMGIALDRIPDIRKFYGEELLASSPIDFSRRFPIKIEGHVIAARVTAENPYDGFAPTSGRIKELNFRSSRDVWGYFSVDSSGNVHEFADSQIGHIFSWGPSRDEARKSLVLALQDLSIRGDIRTTVEYLENLLEDTTYKQNQFDTAWLDGKIKSEKVTKSVARIEPLLAVAAGAACQGYVTFKENEEAYLDMLSRGQMPGKDLLARATKLELILDGIKYPLFVSLSGPESVQVALNDSSVSVGIKTLADEGFLVIIGGKSHTVYLKEEIGSIRMVIDNVTCIFAEEYDPTKLQAKMGGKLLRYLVPNGSKVAKNQPFAEIEVMKMNMQLLAKENGVLSFIKPEGSVMEPGDLICRMEVEDPSTISRATLFHGSLPQFGRPKPSVLASMPQSILESSLEILNNQLLGYAIDSSTSLEALSNLVLVFGNSNLPILKVEDALARAKHTLPVEIYEKLISIGEEFMVEESKRSPGETDGLDYCKRIKDCVANETFVGEIGEVLAIVSEFEEGLGFALVTSLCKLLKEFLTVENVFARVERSDSAQKDDTLQELRRYYNGQPDKVLGLDLAHHAVKQRSWLVTKIMWKLEKYLNTVHRQETMKYGIDVLSQVAGLNSGSCATVALEARQALFALQHKTHTEQLYQMKEKLIQIKETGEKDLFNELVSQSDSVLHFLMEIVSTESDEGLKRVALELYIRRVYAGYTVASVDSENGLSRFVFHSEAESQVQPNTGMVSSASFENLSAFNLTESEPDVESENSGSGRFVRASSISHNDVIVSANVNRVGLIACFRSFSELESGLEEFAGKISSMEPGIVNVLHVLLTEVDSSNIGSKLEKLMVGSQQTLEKYGVRRITVAVMPVYEGEQKPTLVSGDGCGFYTFRHSAQYKEDKLVRNTEAPLAFRLDLGRLSNFSIEAISLGKTLVQKMSNTIHIYRGRAKENSSIERYFVRGLIRQLGKVEDLKSISKLDAYPGPERVFLNGLTALESLPNNRSNQNHMYFYLLGDVNLEATFVEEVIKSLTKRYASRLREVGVGQLELRFQAANGLPMRIFMENPTGFNLEVARYVEATDPLDPESKCFYAVESFLHEGKNDFDEDEILPHEQAKLHGQPITTPYTVSSPIDQRRSRALAVGTAYVYDFPTFFLKALYYEWKGFSAPTPTNFSDMFTARELVLEEELTSGEKLGNGLVLSDRASGKNTIGMVAWLFMMKTPEFPEGREIVVIANDITHKAGSFGTKEDELFLKASELARARKIPRIYIAANSGARIGMAEEVKRCFKIKFKDESDPEQGFEYLYVTNKDYEALGPAGKKAINAEETTLDGEKVYKIIDIIGEGRDLGVENLRGSGTIAGETSRAYEETFTLTYVSARSVGIGAYLVRLGQRTIQKGTNAPIILTGFSALNALMGKEVYTSNLQLGGTQVMYNNGVTHECVRNDLEGVQAIIKWLSYVPKTMKLEALPILPVSDTVDRDVTYDPTNESIGLPAEIDPRKLLAGSKALGLTGFCDKNSFKEYLAGWAKTVIVGRGRLGGIPHGVIITETRTMEKTSPADPAAPASQENKFNQAGQVWFPDSGYKTSQAISDFNKEKLPLFIFANWRGFSGGQRDMFDEVLKFGAFIVDELVKYKQPVFVYLVPKGELRGGAWVVLDETINTSYMEMYSESTSRGNVLEPPGAASIKFRKVDILKTMHRVDGKLKDLDAKYAVEKTPELKKAIEAREVQLFPVYKQVSLQFADLHDTPGRMSTKGVIREVVPWKDSRRFFYHRLVLRIKEVSIQNELELDSFSLKNIASDADLTDKKLTDWSNSSAGVKAIEDYKKKVKAGKLLAQLQSLDILASSQSLSKLKEELKSLSN
eukprot:snap_masked-scaffold_6-processed-gene-10.9-mRNA-1 protein AED:0.05 eAED:0.05 QI:0/-1/0/1/-1/1/1/0/2208